MNKINELLSDLKSVTERSQPNIKFREQMDLIEAIEIEIQSMEYVIPELTLNETEQESGESTMDGESTAIVTKRGRKPAKQDN